MEFTQKPVKQGVEGFSERLKKVLGNESVRSFCRRLGMSDRGFRAYLDGSSYPSLEKLVAIANTGNVSVEWLAVGKGHRVPTHSDSEGSVNPTSQSEKIVEMINELSEENRREILLRIESLHEASRDRQRMEKLLNEVAELKSKLA